MRKVLLLAIALSMVPAAFSFPAQLVTVKDSASPGNPAVFHLRITNNLSETETFRAQIIKSTQPGWYYVEGAEEIEPGETRSINISVNPSADALSGNYGFTVSTHYIGSDSYQRYHGSFRVDREVSFQVYSTSVNRPYVRPGEAFKVSVKVRNLAPGTLREYRAEATFMGKELNDTSSPIIRGGERTLEFNFEVPEEVSPGPRKVRISVYRFGELFTTVNETVHVESVRGINKSSNVRNRLLLYTGILRGTNTGNSQDTVQLEASVPSYLAPITTFSEDPDQVISRDGVKKYYWNFGSVEPGETVRVSYTINYWMPTLVALVILAGILAIRRLTNQIRFVKRTESIEEDRIKVSLEIANRKGSKIEQMSVHDFVSDIAAVSEEFEMAEPLIRKTSDGTKLTWDIEDLKPGEQRIFQYVIEPKVSVEGEATLPAAELEIEGETRKRTGEPRTEFRAE
ncbi:MAG: hypothetical protein ABEK01_04485 [Candidatus Nanohaloarchaea archaeon]